MYSFSEEELDLLRVLLAPSTQRVSIWQNWKQQFSIEQSSEYSKRQFSRVYASLDQVGVDEPELESYYKENLKRTNQYLSMSRPFFQHQENVSRKAVVLKSFSLILLGYEKIGSRRYFDIDVMVPYGELDSAYSYLLENQWQPLIEGDLVYLNYRRFTHSVDLKKKGNGKLDLHWHMVDTSPNADLDQALWERTRNCNFAGQTYTLLSSTDLFLNLILHGAGSIERKYDWLIDCKILLEHEESQIDWDAVLHQVRTRELVLSLQIAVEFMHKLGVELPEQFIENVHNEKLGLSDKLDRYNHLRGFNTFLGGAPRKLATVLRVQKGPIETSLPLTFIDYLALRWRLEKRRQVFYCFALKLARIQARVFNWVARK